jgi:hypothetical protein
MDMPGFTGGRVDEEGMKAPGVWVFRAQKHNPWTIKTYTIIAKKLST